MQPYQKFAKIYDDLMDPVMYDQWLAYVKKHIHLNQSILELGCGSGRLGVMLVKAGYTLTGLDNSSEMLMLASDRQQEEQVDFLLLERDMTDLSELPSYDNVISFNDSICYLSNKEEVYNTFKEVYSVLNDNGVFLFDVHSPNKMKSFIHQSFHAETEDGMLIWDSYEGEHPHSVEHDLSIFSQINTNQYERFNETHYERTYPYKEYKQLLIDAGFSDIEVTSDFKDEFHEEGSRWFFKAVK